MRKWPQFAPRPFELLALGLVAAIVLFLRARGLRLDGRTVSYMAAAIGRRLPTIVALGVGLRLLAHLLAWRSPLPWLRSFLAPRSLGLWLRTWLVMAAVTYAYCWFKVSVPLLRNGILDPVLWRLDRLLHFGVSPSILAVELARGSALASALDLWYVLWLTSVLAMQSYVLLDGDRAKRRNFAFACSALWLVGAWVYFALPAVGPCFFVPEVFAEIRSQLPNASHLQGRLWENYLTLLAGREHGVRQLKPFLAVAAMPSLHVGAHWLFALWARRHAPRLFLPWAAATLLTFVGSLATGWHYAVDGYAGLLLAWGSVLLADRLEPAPSPAAAPARGSGARDGATPPP